MTYIKNLTDSTFDLSILGVYLDVGEVRDISEFTIRDELDRKASVVIEYINDEFISFLDGNMIPYDKVTAIQFVLNVYNKVTLTNDIPIIITSTTESKKFYFVKDDNLELKKGQTVNKTFMGDLHTLELYTRYSNVEMTISMNGLTFPTETLKKHQSFSFTFDGLAEDVTISLKSTKYCKPIEIYMDGKATATTAELQSFINNWSS